VESNHRCEVVKLLICCCTSRDERGFGIVRLRGGVVSRLWG
jgi:hypothetical protein